VRVANAQRAVVRSGERADPAEVAAREPEIVAHIVAVAAEHTDKSVARPPQSALTPEQVG